MLSFDHVSKQFATVRAVDDLSFEVADGEIFALLGPNGAGKTTSVRMIMQLIEPDSGRIGFNPALLHGRQVDRSRLGYLPEERGLYQDATVLNNLLYLAGLRGCPATEARPRAARWLERLELAERAGDKVSTLSKGNQQKVQFIASILHQPRFVVLDEPFSGLDPINQERMCDWIRELPGQGSTVLLSAHQLQLVERIADRILLIDGGRERMHGTLDEIRAGTVATTILLVDYAGEVRTEVLAGAPGIGRFSRTADGRWEIHLETAADLNQTLSELCAAGRIKRLDTSTPSLHEIFVQSFSRQVDVQ